MRIETFRYYILSCASLFLSLSFFTHNSFLLLPRVLGLLSMEFLVSMVLMLFSFLSHSMDTLFSIHSETLLDLRTFHGIIAEIGRIFCSSMKLGEIRSSCFILFFLLYVILFFLAITSLVFRFFFKSTTIAIQ